MKIFLLSIVALLSLHSAEYYYEYDKKVTMVKLHEQRSNADVTYYEDMYGNKIGVKNEIILKCKDENRCMKLLKTYDLSNITKLSDTLFLLKLPRDTNIFELSRRLYKEDSIVFAHPNFIKERKRR